MIDHTASSHINTNGLNSQAFSIEINAHMFSMLTSKVYNNPLLAVMREWSTNALDACRAAKAEISFDVHLPLIDEPTFSVRDYGTGLSESDLVGLFCTLGASTKRNSNEYNGAFGIGRMAGLAYSDSFTVESYHQGHYYSYLIAVSDGTPTAIQLASTPSSEPSGLRLSVAVKPDDIKAFHTTAQSLYKYFSVKPNLNIDLDLSQKVTMEISADWFAESSVPDTHANYVLMSDVLYKIPAYISGLKMHDFSSIVLRVPTGAVSINPGRESLSMDSATIEYLNTRFEQVLADYLLNSESAILAESVPIKQLQLMASAVKYAPSGIRQRLTRHLGSISTISQYVDFQQAYHFAYGKFLKPSHFDCRVRHSAYKSLRPISDLDLHELVKDSFTCLIVDQKTGWRQILDTLPSHALVLSNSTYSDLSTFATAAEQWCTNLGLPFTRTSSYTVEEVAKQVAIREGVYVSYSYGNGSFGTPEKSKPTSYVYCNISGTSYADVPTHTVEQITLLLDIINRAHATSYRLVGVAKKYQSLAQQDPNFTHFLDLFATQVQGLPTLPVRNPSHRPSLSMNSLTRKDLRASTKLATHPVTQYLDDGVNYSKWFDNHKHIYSADLVESLVTLYPSITIDRYTFTTDYKQLISDYPLLENMHFNSFEDLSHYLTIQDHYNDFHRAHSDLSSDTTSEPESLAS